MKWLIHHYHQVRYGIAACIGAMVVLAALKVPGASSLAAVGLFLLVFYLVVLGKKLSEATGEGTVEFYRDCDPQPLLATCDKLLAGAGEDCRSPYVIGMRTNRVNTLRALGRTGEAEEELNRLEALLSGKKGEEEMVLCRYARLSTDLDRGLTAGAEEAIAQMRGMLEDCRTPSVFAGLTWAEVLGRLLDLSECRLTLAQYGPVPELEGRLKDLIPTLPGALYQVQGAWLLGEYHMARGEYNRARRPLTFAAERGGTTETARQARRTLDTIASR